MKLSYFITRVLSSVPKSGNEVLVFPDAVGLTPLQMQTIATEKNFQETVFFLRPEGPDSFWKAWFFTPTQEIAFSGQSILGVARTIYDLGWVNGEGIVFQQAIGPIKVDFLSDNWISLTLPRPIFGPVFEVPDKIAPIVGLKGQDLGTQAEGQLVTCGLTFLILPMRDRATLKRAKIVPELEEPARKSLKFDGIYLWCHGDRAGEYHTRFLAPNLGIVEDISDASGAGPFVCYLLRQGVEELAAGTLRITIHQNDKTGEFFQLRAQAWWDNVFTKVSIEGQSFNDSQCEMEI